MFVNPYMTLVAAYERLIGERGTELADPSVVATADPDATGRSSASGVPIRLVQAPQRRPQADKTRRANGRRHQRQATPPKPAAKARR